MDIGKIIADLRAEHEQVLAAITSLERLASNGVKKRGRPPKWMAQAKEVAAPVVKRGRGRPKGSTNKVAVAQ